MAISPGQIHFAAVAKPNYSRNASPTLEKWLCVSTKIIWIAARPNQSDAALDGCDANRIEKDAALCPPKRTQTKSISASPDKCVLRSLLLRNVPLVSAEKQTDYEVVVKSNHSRNASPALERSQSASTERTQIILISARTNQSTERKSRRCVNRGLKNRFYDVLWRSAQWIGWRAMSLWANTARSSSSQSRIIIETQLLCVSTEKDTN